MTCTRWETAGVRTDVGRNVPLQLRRVLQAMGSDLTQPAPHHDFLQCLDRNSFRRKKKQTKEMFHIHVIYLTTRDNETVVLQFIRSTMLMKCSSLS